MLQLTDQWVDELSFRSFLLIKSHSKEAQCWFYIEKFTAVLPSSTKTMMKNYEEYEEMFLYSKTKCNGVFRRSSSIHTPKTFTCLIWVLNPELWAVTFDVNMWWQLSISAASFICFLWIKTSNCELCVCFTLFTSCRVFIFLCDGFCVSGEQFGDAN